MGKFNIDDFKKSNLYNQLISSQKVMWIML